MLLPYSGVIPVKSVMVEKEMASVLNRVISLRSSCLYPSSLRRFSPESTAASSPAPAMATPPAPSFLLLLQTEA
uniref:Uncharacterized protein n=1 Tax=Arundo donax TaxID=35708 RepID=A0A0A9B8Z3_ARUDO